MPATTSPQSTDPRTSGAPPSAATISPPTPARRGLRLPQLSVGLLLVAGAALAFVLWNAASVQRVAVLALSHDVERGHVLAVDDLKSVQVATDDEVAVTPTEDVDTLLGRVAITNLTAGTFVTADQFVDGATLVPGSGVVGLALSPGQYPTPRLRVGDLVTVLDVTAGRQVLVDAAEVVSVDPIGTQGQRFVSLLAGEDAAGDVAAAAAAGEVRLVLVARDATEGDAR